MKKILILLSTIFLISIIYFSVKYFTTNNYITSDEAIKIATLDISNKDNEYFFNTIDFKETNGTYIYTLEFNDKENSYIYKINAKTKKIISSKKESLNNNKIYISEEEIISIVFNHANINKNNANILSNAVLLEDGNPIYNTVFYSNNIRYEYKTNALTGSVISVTKLQEKNFE